MENSTFSECMNVSYLGNELWRYFTFAAVLLGLMLAGKIAQFFFKKSAKKCLSFNRDIAAIVFKKIADKIYFLSFSLGLLIGDRFLYLPGNLENLANTATAVILTLAIGLMVLGLTEVPVALLRKFLARRDSNMGEMVIPAIHRTLQAAVILLTVVQIAQILSNQPISSILAGLGIGGLAIGLAAKDSVANLFGSLVIFSDKPFELHERVKIGSNEGFVESVGMRSTRIRTLTGHLLAVPNADLANKTIENVSARPFIKKNINLGLTYDTPAEDIEKALAVLQEIFKDHEGSTEARPARIYFNDFNDWALNIVITIWYHPANYYDYMQFCQTVNLEIKKRFDAEGLKFAFPSQSLYLEKGEAPLQIEGLKN